MKKEKTDSCQSGITKCIFPHQTKMQTIPIKIMIKL